MFVTRHSNIVDIVLADKLWALYEHAYRGSAETVVTREMLFRTEFDSAIADPTNRTWVLWDDAAPIGVGLMATDIGATRYLSRAFFEHNYPEHTQREAVRYVMWVVIHPAYEARGAAVRLIREGLSLEAADGALVVFDSTDVNQPDDGGGFAELVTRLSRGLGAREPVKLLGTSRYYAVDFADSSRFRHPATVTPAATGERRRRSVS